VTADALAISLSAIAPVAEVERRGALAVLRVRDARPFADAALRTAALAAAAAHGVTHLALELLTTEEATDDPSLPRD
jgi:hypothetical protein